MKISKKIATLLSCVMVGGCLASCGKNGNDSSSPEKPEKPEEPEKTITIAEIPQVCVTDTLDLSSYITCTGGTGSYTITVGESAQDFAGLDITGKKIFADHSGEVPFTVTYSGKTAQGSVSFVSEEYVKFLEQSKDRGYDYAVYGLDDNFYGIESCYNFAENFMIDLYNLEGYFESEGQVYSVALEIDDQDEISASYSLTGYEPDDISEVSIPWNIDPSVVKSVYVPEEVYQGKTYEAYESVVIDEVDTLKTLCGPLFGYSYDLLVRNDVTPTKIELSTDYLTDDKGGKVECFDAYLYVYGEMMDGSFDEGLFYIVILELQDGKMITGKQSELLSAASAMLINAVKEITKIPDEVYLLSPSILEAIFLSAAKMTPSLI